MNVKIIVLKCQKCNEAVLSMSLSLSLSLSLSIVFRSQLLITQSSQAKKQMIQREHPGQRKESQTGPQNSQVGQSSQGVCTLVHFIVMVYNNEDGG